MSTTILVHSQSGDLLFSFSTFLARLDNGISTMHKVSLFALEPCPLLGDPVGKLIDQAVAD
jgi:hypothetical protein